MMMRKYVRSDFFMFDMFSAEMEKQVEDALNKVEKAANANKIAAVIDADSKLNDVLAAVDSQQPQRAMANLQQLSGVVANLQKELGQTPAAGEASAFIEPVKDVIRKANDALQNPGDDAKVLFSLSPPNP